MRFGNHTDCVRTVEPLQVNLECSTVHLSNFLPKVLTVSTERYLSLKALKLLHKSTTLALKKPFYVGLQPFLLFSGWNTSSISLGKRWLSALLVTWSNHDGSSERFRSVLNWRRTVWSARTAKDMTKITVRARDCPVDSGQRRPSDRCDWARNRRRSCG